MRLRRGCPGHLARRRASRLCPGMTRYQREFADMSLFDMPFDPAREAALVTGAGNGIGRAIAQALVGEGVRTVFAHVNGDTVTAAVKASPRPDLAVPFVGDLASREACDALLAHAQSAVGQVTHFRY